MLKKLIAIIMIITAGNAVAQKIYNIVITNIGDNYAVIKWEMNPAGTGSVYFGESPTIMNSVSASVGTATQHNVLLAGLKSGTSYFCFIKSSIRNASGQLLITDNMKFTTKGIPPAQLGGVSVISNSRDHFIVHWEANVPVYPKLTYIREGSAQKSILSNTSANTNGTFLVSGLSPLTMYYYFFEGRSQNGISLKTSIKSQTTAENNIALNCPVTGSFSNFAPDPYFNREGNLNGRITDGKLEYFKGMAVSGNIRKSDQWCEIDLGNLSTISHILVYWRSLSYSTNYDLFVSQDRKDWKLVAGGLNPSGSPIIRGDAGDPIVMNDAIVQATSVRYVRLLAKKGAFHVKHAYWEFVELMEIKVYP